MVTIDFFIIANYFSRTQSSSQSGAPARDQPPKAVSWTVVGATACSWDAHRAYTAYEVYLGLYQAITGPEERQFPLYERGYTWELLETLERARGHKEPAALDGAQVEHVLPQTLNDAWIEALGSVLASLRNVALETAVIIEPDARVWLVEPTNGYFGYKRTFPKGTQDSDYSLAATAAKEVFEETGLRVEIGPPLIDVERKNTVCRYFLARRIAGDPSDMGWETQAVCLAPVAFLSDQKEMPPSEYDRPILLALLSWLSSHSETLTWLENPFSPTAATPSR